LTALFTATSAVCVTGLVVVVDTGTYWSPMGQGLVMALFQLGGFGMMTSAMLMGLLIGGHMKLRTRLLQSETHALSVAQGVIIALMYAGRVGVVVIGLGRFGSSVARAGGRWPRRAGHRTDQEVVQDLAHELPHVVKADSTELPALQQLSVTGFSHAVVSIGANLEASVPTVLNLAQMGVKDIWAKANSPQHGRIAERVGAHHVIYPEVDMGERVAHLVTGKMIDFIEFDDGFAIAKTRAPMETHDKTLAVSNVRQKYGITVVGIKRRYQDFIYAKPDTEIKPGDHLILAGPTPLVEKFAALY
jgi:trk system potassium uptake protein TrkA